MIIDRSKSIAELENKYWNEPVYSSYLVRTCHSLREKPLEDFTPEDLRIMIGQQFYLPYLIPIALEFLDTDILSSGDMYDGDLLCILLGIDRVYWRAYPQQRILLLKMIEEQWNSLMDEDLIEEITIPVNLIKDD